MMSSRNLSPKKTCLSWTNNVSFVVGFVCSLLVWRESSGGAWRWTVLILFFWTVLIRKTGSGLFFWSLVALLSKLSFSLHVPRETYLIMRSRVFYFFNGCSRRKPIHRPHLRPSGFRKHCWGSARVQCIVQSVEVGIRNDVLRADGTHVADSDVAFTLSSRVPQRMTLALAGFCVADSALG